MRMYTNASNARRAAKSFVDQHADVLEVASPVRAPGVTPMFYPAATLMAGATVDAALKTTIDESLKLVDADEGDEPAPAKKAKAPKAAKAKPAKKAKAPKPAKAPKAAKAPRVTMSSKALDLMSAKGGATAEKLQSELGWLPHTVRGFVSLTNKKRREAKPALPEIQTERKDGVTKYILGA